jgi:hypothetical protein
MGEVAARTDARRRQPLNLFRRGLITFYVQRQDRFGIIELNISNDLSLGKITIFVNSSSGSIGPTALDDSQFAYQHIANKFGLTRQYTAQVAKRSGIDGSGDDANANASACYAVTLV